MDESGEFYFVQNGKYIVGFEINKKIKFRLQFGPRTLISSFHVMFDKRVGEVYKSSNDLHCVAIRKNKWKKLMFDHPYFSNCLKIKVLYMYDKHIRLPLLEQRKAQIKRYSVRNDYQQLCIVEAQNN